MKEQTVEKIFFSIVGVLITLLIVACVGMATSSYLCYQKHGVLQCEAKTINGIDGVTYE